MTNLSALPMPPAGHGGAGRPWPAPSSVGYARGLLFVQASIWGLLCGAAILIAAQSDPWFGTGWTLAVVSVCCGLSWAKAWLSFQLPRGLDWTRQAVIVTEVAMAGFAVVLCLVTSNLIFPLGLAFFAGFVGGILSLVAAIRLVRPSARQFFAAGSPVSQAGPEARPGDCGGALSSVTPEMPALPAPRRRLYPKLIVLVVIVAAAVSGGVAALAREVASNTLHDIQPTKSMMIGTWRSPAGAVLTLRADGTFTERGLPWNAGESSTLNIPEQGDGSWRIGPPGQSAGVTFDFALPGSTTPQQMLLVVERNRSTVIMYYDKGDPDEGVSGQYQFTKTR